MVPITTYQKTKPLVDNILQRIPGITSWLLITSPIWGSLLFPTFYGVFLICFIVLWFLKSIRNLLFFIYSFNKMQRYKKMEWNKLPIKSLDRSGNDRDKLRHIIIIPLYKEGYNVLAPVIKSLMDQDFNTLQVYICLTYEKREPNGRLVSERLQNEFGKYFGAIWINEHELIEGEIAGKGSNCKSAGYYIEKIVNSEKWDLDNTILISSDCDSIYPRNYFSYLSYEFLKEPNRDYIFWAGSMAYLQNYWELPYFSRVLNSAFSFYNISTIARAQTKFVQISTYAGSWKLLKSIGFYESGLISDDFHTFFMALFKHFDKVRCQSLYLIIDSDACEGTSWIDNFKRQFKQVERWAWGVEDFTYLVKSWYLTLKMKLPLSTKLYITVRVYSVIFDHILWPVNGIIFALGSWAIYYLSRVNEFSIFWANTSQILSTIFSISTILGIVAIIVSHYLRPANPKLSMYKSRVVRVIYYILDLLIELFYWVIFPIFSFLLSSVPAILAHTRLMMNKHLGFVLTMKK